MDDSGVPADASSLIYLAKTGGLQYAVACLGPLLMTPRVWVEVVEFGERRGATDVALIRAAIAGRSIRKSKLDEAHSERAERIAADFGLGLGESEVLACADQHPFVLLDEKRATRAANALGISTIGTIVVPALCARAGVLDKTAALVLLDAIARHTTFTNELMIRARRRIAEAPP